MRYLTHYEEYLIFTPEEGGYYYEGNDVVSTEKLSKQKAKSELIKIYDELVSEYGECDEYKYPKFWMSDDGNELHKVNSRYIGDAESWVIERKLGSQKSGWTPYC